MTEQLLLGLLNSEVHVHKWHRIVFRDYSWRQCFACGASTWHAHVVRDATDDEWKFRARMGLEGCAG